MKKKSPRKISLSQYKKKLLFIQVQVFCLFEEGEYVQNLPLHHKLDLYMSSRFLHRKLTLEKNKSLLLISNCTASLS